MNDWRTTYTTPVPYSLELSAIKLHLSGAEAKPPETEIVLKPSVFTMYLFAFYIHHKTVSEQAVG